MHTQVAFHLFGGRCIICLHDRCAPRLALTAAQLMCRKPCVKRLPACQRPPNAGRRLVIEPTTACLQHRPKRDLVFRKKKNRPPLLAVLFYCRTKTIYPVSTFQGSARSSLAWHALHALAYAAYECLCSSCNTTEKEVVCVNVCI